jgi:5-deoxy-5-amino-3-dehydroquinate synthase|tara:strand:+ start:117115 stop:118125 length:1011 start_codon:yes stop_codon:yes gene_type:complete
MNMKAIKVDLAERSYPVLVGENCLGEVERYLPSSAKRVAIVTQEQIGIDLQIEKNHKVFTIGTGETSKSIDSVIALCRSWVDWGLTRSDIVIGLGGGMVTDIAAFAASIYHRGLEVINVPTTLLGMVDAAIGGKTGANLPEGKNLIGTFWQPKAVICDVDTLQTLPEREWKCGYGEVAKYHFLGADDMRGFSLIDTVMECVKVKTRIVAEDEREAGTRAILNYGHTLAHAIELENGFALAHGEAVAVGIRYAAQVAFHMGRIGEERVAYHEEILNHYGLQMKLGERIDPQRALLLFSRDKKSKPGLFTFVLDGDLGVEPVSFYDGNILVKALEVVQ